MDRSRFHDPERSLERGTSRLPTLRGRPLLAATALLTAVLVQPSVCRAQGGEGFVTFQFSFSNPGARSLGFGGAFVALADDATAAFVNPAGLVQLIEPEISIEGRLTSFSTPYTLAGRIDGQPTGIGVDTSVGLRTATSDDDVVGPSFLSWVYPTKHWWIALYRHQLANFEFSSRTEILLRATDPSNPQGTTSRQLDSRASTDSESVAWGFSAARQVTDDLSLGFGLTLVDGSLSSTVEAFYPDSYGRFFEPNSYLQENLVATVAYELEDVAFGATGGFLWRMSRLWSLGGFYRRGPKLWIDSETRAGPHGLFGPPDTLLQEISFPLHYPDVYGLGAAFRSANGRSTVSFEWDRVEYSTILDKLGVDSDVELDDGDELRVGGEYVFVRTTPVVALRLGSWLDPDHRTRATADADRTQKALFWPGSDEIHVAIGLGVVFPSLQIDFAVDFSDLVDTVSLSTIFSF